METRIYYIPRPFAPLSDTALDRMLADLADLPTEGDEWKAGQ
jgi:hypothetical protein